MDFEALVRAHQAAVCATAYAVLRDRGRAEEVAQDAFLIAWQKLPALAERPELPAWICGIARNLARNVARKKREVPVHDDRDDASSADGPLDSLLSNEARTIAERALAALDERDREVMALYYMGDGSHADVARALGIAEANARQRVHRARAKLRDAASAVESTLRAARPGTAFTLACVAALAAGRVVDAEAATAAATKTGVGALAIGIGAAAVVIATTAAVAVKSSSPRAESPRSAATSLPVANGSAAVAIDRAAVLHRISPAMRTDLLERVRVATTASSPPSAPSVRPPPIVYDFAGANLGSANTQPPPKPGASPKTLIRYAIQELQPLLAECHAGLASKGTITMDILLVGAPDIGTVVESVAIDPAEDPHAPPFEDSFTECMRETLYAIELPAMTTTERWDEHFPFTVK